MSIKNVPGQIMRKIIPSRLDGDDFPIWRALETSTRRQIVSSIIGVVAIITTLVVLFPIYWMIATSGIPRADLYQIPMPLIPENVALDNYVRLFERTDYATWYVNTLLFSFGVVLTTTTAATLGGYGLTRIDVPYKRTFARGILFGYMFPPILLAIPMYILWNQIGIINSIPGLVLAQTAVTLPFSLWLMWQYFQTVPISLEESAHMAGATRFEGFIHIALPLAKPGMIAVGIFSFAVAWGTFTIPHILMVDRDQWVLVQGLHSFTLEGVVIWEQVMSGSVLAMIPPFLFVFFLQKYFLQGFRTGGVG